MKYVKILGLAASIGFFAACQNDPLSDLTVEDSQVFITNHDQSVNFSQYKTFSIVDSVLIVGNQGTRPTLTATEVSFLNTIIQEMQNLGYKYVSPKDKPDVGINVMRVSNTYINVVTQPINPYYGNFWGSGFGGGFFPGYGYGYPSTYSYYQTRENYWYLQMVDFKNPNVAEQQYDVVWDAEIRGSGLFDGVDFETMIRSVFGQSSYLKVN